MARGLASGAVTVASEHEMLTNDKQTTKYDKNAKIYNFCKVLTADMLTVQMDFTI